MHHALEGADVVLGLEFISELDPLRGKRGKVARVLAPAVVDHQEIDVGTHILKPLLRSANRCGSKLGKEAAHDARGEG